MTSRIVILSHPEDVHAIAVAEVLRRRAADVALWYTSAFPTRRTESIYLDGHRQRLRIRGPEIDLTDPNIAVVWNRRPTHWLDEKLLHPGDLEFAEISCRCFRTSSLNLLAPNAFWVNPPGSEQRCNKMVQQRLASQLGLKIPPTLYSNDPAEIRDFIRRQGGTVVYKPLPRRYPGRIRVGKNVHRSIPAYWRKTNSLKTIC